MSSSKMFLLAVLLFVGKSVCGADLFRPGYVINHRGDTLQGYIEYRNWSTNPQVIHFRSTPTAQVVSYKPADLSAFSVAEEYYESAAIQVESSSNSFDRLSDSADFELKADTVFLQALVKGRKSLYFLKNREGQSFFFIKQGDQYVWLGYKRYRKQENGKNLIASNNLYIHQLQQYLNDCKDLILLISQTSYKTSSLNKLFNSYYTCTTDSANYTLPQEKMKTEFGLLMGVSTASFNFTSTQSFYLSGRHRGSTNLLGGIFLDLGLPRNFNRWSIYNELVVTSYTVEGSLTANQYQRHDVVFGQTQLKLTNLLRYKLSSFAEGGFYLNVGMANAFGIAEKNERITHRQYLSDAVTYDKALEIMRKYEQALVLGCGTNYKRFSLQARVDFGNGFSDYSSFKVSSTRYSLLFGYRL
ncbi:hypothetical protein [Olivibacter sp. XZL3]|uniref:hypothetical protein n=1 Tax=Olivibacter sp. XZL3 TaxID=1735116 RepID=UPI001066509C|nr:hypothetical protein [Olivibacter sp. XZL3]